MKILDIYTLTKNEKYNILFEYLEEKELRENNESVKLAWEHYKTLVKLAHSGKDPEPIDETQFG